MDNKPQDALKLLVGTYYNELEHLATLDIGMERLISTAILVEQVLGVHFPPKEVRIEGKRNNQSLGDFVFSREDFLDSELVSRLRKVVWIRNRDSHFHKDGKPSRDERQFAIENLEQVVQAHLTELATRSGFNKREWDKKIKNEQSPRLGLANLHTSPANKNRQEPANKNRQDEVIAEAIDRPQKPSLEASEKDPSLSVSTVAEYAFCPRAGMLSHEGAYSDREEELPSLRPLPWYEQDAIEEAYVGSVYWLFVWVVMFVVGLVILSITMLGHDLFVVILAIGVSSWGILVKTAFMKWRKLGARRLAINLATDCNPDPYSITPQSVDWWGLLKAGFEVRRPESASTDEQWRLSGNPHRILQKGSMTIPVHKIKKTCGPLLPQHLVRAMALCHVIEAAEGAVCPFAIILFENTYLGTTVPNTTAAREQFYTALERVRTMISDSDAGKQQPSEPVTGSVCRGCLHGEPRPAALQKKTMRYGEPLNPFLLASKSNKVFHCDCGDRFRWKPLHERNEKLKRVE